MRCFLSICLLFLCGQCFGQRFAVGLKGGIRASDDLSGWSAVGESRRYAVGPMGVIGLTGRISLEVDALYRRFGYTSASTDIIGDFSLTRARANVWEFPILARFRVAGPFYAAVGVAPRRMSGSSQGLYIGRDFYTGLVNTVFNSTTTDHYDASVGGVAAVGASFGRRLKFSPEFRYTHWNSQPLQFNGSHGAHYESTQDQMEVMLGITFGR
jgi:hypothetical protein